MFLIFCLQSIVYPQTVVGDAVKFTMTNNLTIFLSQGLIERFSPDNSEIKSL